MPQDEALLCFKGFIRNFRIISDKNLSYQRFVQNLVKILKIFHFVQKCTHFECQWNVLFYYMYPIYTQNLVAMETGIYWKFLQRLDI